MFKEFFEAISGQAVKASGLKVIKLPGPEHIYLIDQGEGRFQIRNTEPPPRKHKAFDISAVVQFAAKHESAAVWYSRVGVVCLTDDDTRRDEVRLVLSLSEQVKAIATISGKPFAQRDLILLMRTTFADCLGAAGDLLAVLRGVRFRSAAGGESMVKHGSRSVGKTLEQEITGTGALPEYVKLQVPVWGNAFLSVQTVRLALEPDPETETFKLIPLPGELERAIEAGEGRLGAVLREQLGKGAALYYGEP